MAIKSNLDKKLKANTQQRHQTRREQRERERESKYLYLGSVLRFIGYFNESIYFYRYFHVAIR